MKNDAAVAEKFGITQPNIWYGAYVFGITPETGFTLRGTVEHGTGSDRYYYYGSSANEVKRSLYIGDVLYTLSSKKILANSLSNINTTITTINLHGQGRCALPGDAGSRSKGETHHETSLFFCHERAARIEPRSFRFRSVLHTR